MASAPQAPVCPDWIWLSHSNVHVAKDRAWFKTYTPFASSLQDSIFTSSRPVPVLGIGSVEIPTKRSPNRTGVSSHGTLCLEQVLHVPDYICNVIGNPIVHDQGYQVQLCGGKMTKGTIKDSRGRNIAYFDPNRPLFVLKVRRDPEGPKLGRYALKKDGSYMISCQWSVAEQLRWQDFQAQKPQEIKNPAPRAAQAVDTDAYTDQEKKFLKAHWRNEYTFLRMHGLRIQKDEDRAKGRSILRAIMRKDDSDDDDPNIKATADQEDPKPQPSKIEFDYLAHRQFMLSLWNLDYRRGALS